MILRKPYAFLIKYFKLIHLFIAVLIGYLLYKSYNLVDFLSLSVANNYNAVISGQIAGLFINYFMYFAIILILGFLIAIYYLLSHKDKPRKFYMYSIIYYIILFILFTIFYDFINDLSNNEITSSGLRAYRDISVIAIIPQVFFLIYTLVTVTGFNIKKFNFGEDLKELEINSEDNEEFEFVVGFDSYKTKRNIRRYIRELKYYVKENSFILTVILMIVTIILGTSMFLNREVYNKSYKSSENVLHNTFTINVLDSIVTNLSFNGNSLSKDKYYVVLKMNITNNSNKSEILDYSNFKLEINNKQVKPLLDKSLYFKDFASPYYGDKISKGTSRIINLAYEINKDEIKNSYKLRIFRGVATKPGEIVAKYNEIKIKPVLLEKVTDANEVSLNENLEFMYSNVGDTIFKITSFQFTKSYQYTYDKCNNRNVCTTLDDIVSVDYSVLGDNRLLIVLDYEFKKDSEATYFISNPALKDFVNNFMKIKYVIDGKTYYSKVINQTPSTLKDKLVLQIGSRVNEAESVSVVFTIRNKNYIITLK